VNVTARGEEQGARRDAETGRARRDEAERVARLAGRDRANGVDTSASLGTTS